MLRTVWVALCVAMVVFAAACGGGKSSPALSQADVRRVMSTLIMASVRDDLAAAAPHLAPREFMGINMTTAPKAFDKLSTAEKLDVQRACFNQLKAVTEGTTLRELSAVDAALAAGTVQIHEKIRKADVAFGGVTSDGKGKPVKLKASLVLYSDNQWHLIQVQEQLGR